MKDKKLQNGIEEIRKITMTTQEKKRVFERVIGSIILQPSKPIHSPWFIYSFISRINKNSLAYYMIIPLIFILTGSGVVLASEGSLPDSIFYPIKVKVVEPVIEALTFSQESKAQYESSLATTRLIEAETLANQGKLDIAKEKQLSDLLTNHTNALDRALNKINKNKSSEKIDEIVTNFHAGMNAHSKILNIILDEENNISSDQENTDVQISKNARSNADKIKNNSNLKNEKRDNSDKYAKRKKEVDSMITSTITDLNKTTSNKSSMREKVISDTNETLNEAKQFLDEANNKEMKGDREDAYKALLNSESAVKEADIFLRTGLKFKGENE